MTLEQLQTAGYSVRKGETAQMIWGKKQESTNKETGQTSSYFQIVFVFNNNQVERSVRNFKEPATDKTETDTVFAPETVDENRPF
jgi:antirestriction protein ArdC